MAVCTGRDKSRGRCLGGLCVHTASGGKAEGELERPAEP